MTLEADGLMPRQPTDPWSIMRSRNNMIKECACERCLWNTTGQCAAPEITLNELGTCKTKVTK